MNSSKFHYFSQFLSILFYIFHLNNVFAAETWPCLKLLDGTNKCHDGKECVPSSLSRGDLVCPSPKCSSEKDCGPFGCNKEMGKCNDFKKTNVGDECTTHFECGPDKLCNNMRKCMSTENFPFFGSSFLRCTVETSTECIAAEECKPNPFAPKTEGVCLKKTDAQTFKDFMIGTTIPIPKGGGEGKACIYMETKCPTPFFCDTDGKCKKTINMKGDVSGHRIPPPPGNMNCRDALDSGETDENKSKCKEREQLCTQPLYIELMKEQCPKTCGYCDGPSFNLAEYVAGRAASGAQRTSGGGAIKTVKVDPLTVCSDRKLAGKESDCPNLKQFCDNPIYKQLMQEECPKTCGFCT